MNWVKIRTALYELLFKHFAPELIAFVTEKAPGLFEDKEWVKKNRELYTKAKQKGLTDEERAKLAAEINKHLNS